MLYIDYLNIPPYEDKKIIKIKKVSDFLPDLNLNPELNVLDIRGCSNRVFTKILPVLDEFPFFDVYATDPIPLNIISRADSYDIFPYDATDDINIGYVLLKSVGGKPFEKIEPLFRRKKHE